MLLNMEFKVFSMETLALNMMLSPLP